MVALFLFVCYNSFGGGFVHAVIAIDSFKGSLTSIQAGNAVLEAFRCFPEMSAEVFPVADGGEGTVIALTAGFGGELVEIPVTGPVGDVVAATYGVLPDGITAVMEMAAAAGLPLVPEHQRDPMHTTTFGVGEMIRHAIERGCRRFIVGIGGSATNDGGTGMLTALGYRFLDRSGNPIPRGAYGLRFLHRVDAEYALPQLNACDFRIACDVDNPLCGACGCSYIYAPQKGARAEDIPVMDAWIQAYARITRELLANADPDLPGAGAAGGMGFAFQSYLNARLEPGIQIVLDEMHIENSIRNADLVITGEGRLDGQTVMGKAPVGIARLAKKYGKPVIALAGCVAQDASVCNEYGIDAYFPVIPGVMTLEEAVEPENAYRNVRNTASQVLRLIQCKL